MIGLLIRVIKLVLILFIYATSWSIICVLKIVENLIKIWISKENNLISTTTDTADIKEVNGDHNKSAIADKLSKDFYTNVISDDLKISLQQVDEQLFFDYFRESNELLVESNLLISDSNNLESTRECFRNSLEDLDIDRENGREHFIDCVKSVSDKMTSYLINTNESTISYLQSKNVERKDINNIKLSMLYTDNFETLSNIKQDGNSGVWLKHFDYENEACGILNEKLVGKNDSGGDDYVLKKDSSNKLKQVSANIIDDLKQKCTSKRTENDFISFLEIQTHKNSNENNLKSDFIDQMCSIEQKDMKFSNKENDCFSLLEIRGQDVNKNDNTNKLEPAFTDEEQRLKISSIGNDYFSFLEKQEHNVDSKNSKNDFNVISTDAMTDLEQKCPVLNATVGSSFLTMQNYEDNKSDEKEKMIIGNLENQVCTDFIVFSEENAKNPDVKNEQNWNFIKKDINIEKNGFLPDSFIENDVINDRKQIKCGTCDTEIKNSYMLFDKDRNYNSEVDSISSDMLLSLTVMKNTKSIPSKFENEHKRKSMVCKTHSHDNISNNYDNTMLKLSNKELLVERKNYLSNFSNQAKNLEPINLISWEILDEKSGSQENEKLIDEFSKKSDQIKKSKLSEISEYIKCSNSLLKGKTEQVQCTEHTISREFLGSCDYSSLNLGKNELIVETQAYKTSFFDEADNLVDFSFTLLETTDKKSECEVNLKEDEQNNINSPEKGNENITKQDMNNNKIETKYDFKFKNEVNVKQLSENIKLSQPECLESHCKIFSLTQSTYNNLETETNFSIQVNKSREKNKIFHENKFQIAEQGEQNQEDLEQAEKQPDIQSSTNNLTILNRKQNVYESDFTILHNDFAMKTMLKHLNLKIVKADIFDKQPFKPFFIKKISESKPCSEPILLVKNFSDLYNATKNINSYFSKEKYFSRNDLNSLQSFSKKDAPKSLRLKGIKNNFCDEKLPRHFLRTVNFNPEKDYHEQLGYEYNKNHELKKCYTVLFGHCSECVAVQSNRKAKKARTTAISPNDSFSHQISSYINSPNRNKPRNVNKPRKRQKKISQKSFNNVFKRVAFAEDIKIFSYDPEDSVIEAYYDNKWVKENKHTDETETTIVPKKTSVVMKKDERYKDTISEVPEILTLKEESIQIKDIPIKPKIVYSKIKQAIPENKEPLEKVKESLYYDNMGFIDDDDCVPPYSFEIDLDDDASTTFEDDAVLISEKVSSTDIIAKTLPRRILDLTRHTERKAKRWIKSANSALSVKKRI